jgi:hypothetical protein
VMTTQETMPLSAAGVAGITSLHSHSSARCSNNTVQARTIH